MTHASRCCICSVGLVLIGKTNLRKLQNKNKTSALPDDAIEKRRRETKKLFKLNLVRQISKKQIRTSSETQKSFPNKIYIKI